ncbi:Pyoverdine/dityrosine biosynthesis protein-domain-containing protein [Xylaria venustula]|nr:Pyoverdine/dityrosine biosynthesis protein-domain-containing protein [Xylaria venustula]
MESSSLNCGSSPFHCILGLFCRSRDGKLLNSEGKDAETITRHWSTILEQLKASKTTFKTLPSSLLVETNCFNIASDILGSVPGQGDNRVRVREIYREAYKSYVGLITRDLHDGLDEPLTEWIETLFISTTTLKPQLIEELPGFTYQSRELTAGKIWKWTRALFVSKAVTEIRPSRKTKTLVRHNSEAVTEKITALFEVMLRNAVVADEWDSSGRNYFSRRVRDFVNRNEPCQMVLPAFPCKSPNDAKVGGSRPDMAERIALETLRAFVASVEKIYVPGATVWIVHDGHLLSSCIGVDDVAITEYESNLQGLYRSIFDSSADRQAIKFCGLSDLFFSEQDNLNAFDTSWFFDPQLVYNPIPTKLSEPAELARKLVMASCGIDRSHLRKLILAQDATVLKTYRGLSRFMLQDLEGPLFAGQSASRKKKTASSVAAEMIARNQAYSNLLELLFPNYIRLSIHAHNNRGPKFGIRLFPRNKVRAIDSIDYRYKPVPVYDFQIPTPWHNSIVKVEGDEIAYLTKASVARQAIVEGRYTGKWLDDGGCFLLREVAMELPPKVDDEKIDMLSVLGVNVGMKKSHLSEVPYITMKKLVISYSNNT